MREEGALKKGVKGPSIRKKKALYKEEKGPL
jgi:hypothetical protein